MEKDFDKEILLEQNKIKDLEEELLIEKQNNKPSLTLKFMSVRELVSNEDPLKAKAIHDKLKEDLKELQMILDCLWK